MEDQNFPAAKKSHLYLCDVWSTKSQKTFVSLVKLYSLNTVVKSEFIYHIRL